MGFPQATKSDGKEKGGSLWLRVTPQMVVGIVMAVPYSVKKKPYIPWLLAFFFLGGLFFFLVGCSTPPTHITVPLDVPPALTSSDVVIVLSQKEMVANVVPSNIDLHDLPTYTGGGLIPALIPEVVDAVVETSNSSVTEENVEPILAALAKYDVGARFREALLPEIRTISWLHVKKVESLYDPHSDPEDRLLPKGTTDALILIKTSYKLTSDFYALNTKAELYIYPRTQQLKKLTPPQEGMDDSHVPFYMKKVSRWSHLPEDNTRDQTIAAERWTRNGGALIQQALDETIDGMCNELLAGLRNPYRY